MLSNFFNADELKMLNEEASLRGVDPDVLLHDVVVKWIGQERWFKTATLISNKIMVESK